jgi:hypothetical protein
MKKQTGVTIVELLVVILVIGIFIAFFAPTIYSRTSNSARITVTKQKMVQLRKAIVGDPELISGGEYVDAGFKGDNGRLPTNLMELVIKPPYPLADSWNSFTKHGWNGPYIRDDESHSFLLDAWGDPIEFLLNTNNDTIGLKSSGPDGEWYNNPALSNDDIQVLF